MDEKQQRSPERDMLGLFRHPAGENPVDEESRTEVAQQIQQMVACRTFTIERPIDEKGGVQHRPDHVIEMADERLPSIKMGIFEYGVDVVELKRALEYAGIGGQGDSQDEQSHAVGGDS